MSPCSDTCTPKPQTGSPGAYRIAFTLTFQCSSCTMLVFEIVILSWASPSETQLTGGGGGGSGLEMREVGFEPLRVEMVCQHSF